MDADKKVARDKIVHVVTRMSAQGTSIETMVNYLMDTVPDLNPDPATTVELVRKAEFVGGDSVFKVAFANGDEVTLKDASLDTTAILLKRAKQHAAAWKAIRTVVFKVVE